MSARSVGAWCLALLPVAVYAVWCAWGVNHLARASLDAGPWRALRALSKGHQLVAGDIERAKGSKVEHPQHRLDRLIGRYLNKDLPKDATVSRADVVPQPVIDPALNGEVYYVASLEAHPGLRPYLDAGSRLTLCWKDDGSCIKDRRVVAVTCDDKGGCAAITTIPADKLALVDARDRLRLFLHR